MRYFSVDFEWWTRPWYRKGRPKVTTMTFAAGNLTDCLRLAKESGEREFSKRKWKIIRTTELAVNHD